MTAERETLAEAMCVVCRETFLVAGSLIEPGTYVTRPCFRHQTAAERATGWLVAELGSDEMREVAADALTSHWPYYGDCRCGWSPSNTSVVAAMRAHMATAALAAITARLTGQGEA